MKKLIYIIVIVFSFQLQAQEIVPKEQQPQYYLNNTYKDKYFKDINGHFNKFIGTWKWQDSPTNPTKVLEITFYKVENHYTGGCFEDRLASSYTYYENGVEIYNTTNGVFGGRFVFPNNLNKLRLIYMEPNPATLGFTYNFVIEFIPNTTLPGTPQLKWDVEVVLEVAENAELPKIPMHIVLTKQ
ncbi:MAG: DUF6705 family protein [Flavobacterium sp.]|jgi:hypothetical protein